MGKRSNFRRRKQDRYFTPPEAVVPLLPHLRGVRAYIEPCYGEGHLKKAITDLTRRINGDYLFCFWQSDTACDARSYQYPMDGPPSSLPTHFITNTPWTRQILHPIIENLSNQLPTWLLFDAAWAHTKQAIPYKNRCVKIVSVGRISWMQNGTSSLDDCAWYLFDKNFTGQTEFYWRENPHINKQEK